MAINIYLHFRYWYDRNTDFLLCSTPEQMTVEYSSNYGGLEIDEIFEHFPYTRFIIMSRDPVERAISYFNSLKNNIYTIEDALCGNTIPKGLIRESHVYSNIIKKILENFQIRNVMVIKADDVRRQPYNVMVEVEKFLNLDEIIKPRDFEYDDMEKVYCATVDGEKTCLEHSKDFRHLHISHSCVERIIIFYEPSIQAINSLLKKKPGWY